MSALSTATPLPTEPIRSDQSLPWAGLATVVFLGVTCGLQMSDNGLQSVLASSIRQTFGVGDALIGALQGIAGILIASALALPLARLGDRFSRKVILLLLIAVWTGLGVLGALAPNFPLFFVGRAAAGITEFAMIPIVYSLIPDLVGERLRVGANLVFAALMALGASAGFYFSGHLLAWVAGAGPDGWLASVEPWRRAMLLIAVAGIPLFLLGLLTRDPPRGHVASMRNRKGDRASLLLFVRSNSRRVALFVAAAGGIALAVQAVLPMIAMALQRRFAANPDEIGQAMGMLTLISSLGSLPVAWVVDRWLRGRLGLHARPVVMGVAAAMAIPCAAALAFAPDTRVAVMLIGGFLLTTCIANALIPTLLQDLVPPDLRAIGFASYSFLIAVFCALGPTLSGSISEYLMADDLLAAISLAAVPTLAMTVACTAIWCLRRY